MAFTTEGTKGCIELLHDETSASTWATEGCKGAIELAGVPAAGGATGKSNPLYGCLGGCLQGSIG